MENFAPEPIPSKDDAEIGTKPCGTFGGYEPILSSSVASNVDGKGKNSLDEVTCCCTWVP